MSESPIVLFHRGVGTDHKGRTRDEILAWDDAKLEATHDFIQWLFPTVQPSVFSHHAPVLTPEDAKTFQGDRDLLGSIVLCMTRMGAFFRARRPWDHANDHNLLRLTRMLDCLMILGLHVEATALHTNITARAKQSGQVSQRTLSEWKRVMSPSPA